MGGDWDIFLQKMIKNIRDQKRVKKDFFCNDDFAGVNLNVEEGSFPWYAAEDEDYLQSSVAEENCGNTKTKRFII